jgi:hypothetical protein
VTAYLQNVVSKTLPGAITKSVADGGINVTTSTWHEINLLTTDEVMYLTIDSVLQGSASFLPTGQTGLEASFLKNFVKLFIGTGYNLAYNPWQSIVSPADEAGGLLAYLDDITLKVQQPFWRRTEYDYMVIGE